MHAAGSGDRPRTPPRSRTARLWRSMWRQRAHALRCPDTPRLDGKLALVTGGGRGIGRATSLGLARRGADLIAASRSEPRDLPGAAFLPLDLADLTSVEASLDTLAEALRQRQLDIVVANAGLWPMRHALSADGHEIAFATNVLGHHTLIRGLQRRDLLADGARIVFVTGDIYVLATDCTSDYRYRGPLGGQFAYCRSKLGNLWQSAELARRFPELNVQRVHPGVIASELAGSARGPVGAIKRALLLSLEEGAQASLTAATQPGLLSGGYLHNTLGPVALRPQDVAADASRAAAFWDRLEALTEQALPVSTRTGPGGTARRPRLTRPLTCPNDGGDPPAEERSPCSTNP